MKAGILQEVGDPQHLYDYPANIRGRLHRLCR